MLTSLREIAAFFVSQRKVVLIAGIRGINSICSLQQRQSLPISPGVKIEFAELMVRLETPGSAGKSCAQLVFGFIRHAGTAGTHALRFERLSLTGQGFAGPQDRVRSVSAHSRPVRDSRDGEVRLICEFHGLT